MLQLRWRKEEEEEEETLGAENGKKERSLHNGKRLLFLSPAAGTWI